MVELLGQEDADHFTEDWRSMVVVRESGELTQAVCRARKPGRGPRKASENGIS